MIGPLHTAMGEAGSTTAGTGTSRIEGLRGPEQPRPAEAGVAAGSWPASEQTVVDLVASAVRQRPAATALVDDTRQLTYAQMWAESGRIAAGLATCQFEPDEVVGLCAQRSAALITGLVGILRAGAACLPLDRSYPPERLAFMLDVTRPRVVVGDRHMLAGLPAGRHRSVALDELPLTPDPNPGSAAASPRRPGGGDLCYVLFTSGSTGQPKGVMLEHRSLANLVRWQLADSPPGAVDRTLQFTPISFDVSFQEILATLAGGGTVVTIRDEDRVEPRRLGAVLMRHRVTRLFLPFVALQGLSLFADELPDLCLREVVTAGEALRCTGSIRRLFGRLPGCDLVNQYGPTETHVVTRHRLTGAPQAWPPLPPIGSAIDGVTLSVVDGSGRPAPAGEPGELVVGGVAVGRGYWRRPDLTSERFGVDQATGVRTYRTGDVVRRRPDGGLDFLGRRDQQVKIRGHRVEPGEVEIALMAHPAVRAAAVVTGGETALERHLVAHVAAVADQVDDLAEHLRARLPAHLIPSRIEAHAALPFTPSGKVDKISLAERAATSAGMSASAVDEQVAAILTEVLGSPPDPRKGFVAAGGDSLSAVRAAAAFTHAFHTPVTVQTLLHSESLLDLARLVLLGPASEHPATHRTRGRRQDSGAPLPRKAGHVTAQRRLPLSTLIERGTLPPIDAAALAYLPPGLSSRQRRRVHRWNRGRPVLSHIVTTGHGCVGLVLLPIQQDLLYLERELLRSLTIDGTRLAARAGAKTVALTGLLASALDYGRVLAGPSVTEVKLPELTTGHAATAAAVALNVAGLIGVAGRALAGECLAVLGLGSIGRTSLQLLLSQVGHPARLILCDLFRTNADQVTDELAAGRYDAAVEFVPARRGAVPDQVYEQATCIVGATNTGRCLDIDRVRPGTLIIDDSAPHCFDPARAVARIKRAADILVTEGGELRASRPMHELRGLAGASRPVAALLSAEETIALRDDPYEIMGCLIAGLLCTAWRLPATIGLVDAATATEHFDALRHHGYGAATPHLGGYRTDSATLAAFRNRFGGSCPQLPSLTVPIPRDLRPACRAGNAVGGTVPNGGQQS